MKIPNAPDYIQGELEFLSNLNRVTAEHTKEIQELIKERIKKIKEELK